MILILGSGRKKYRDAVTLDKDINLHPDIVCNLGVDSIPLDADVVKLVVALNILQYIGRQGETTSWFKFWEEIYRVMKPSAILQFECPKWDSAWMWADPCCTRVIVPETFLYLNQDNYRDPERDLAPHRIRCDFIHQESHELNSDYWGGTLQARKPLSTWWVN